MSFAQLTGRHFRLRHELAAAYGALPWKTRRIERLSSDIAQADRDIALVRAHGTTDAQPVLRPETSHAWLGLFAAHLMQMRPSMDAGSAVRYAVASFHHGAGLDPRRAAQLLVSGEPHTKAIERPVQAAIPSEPQSARYEAMFAGRDLILQ